jgi:hypothetical protein
MLMLAEATNSTRPDVLAAIKQASAATGSDFQYLLGTAMRESGLKPSAKAPTSSASGLFQFTQQTWLGMVKQHGAKYGLGSYASAITRDGRRYHVSDRADRSAILSLRNDPKTAALMEGEYANDTRCQLRGELGRDVCSGELYAAHFLGPGAACRLIRMNQSHPTTDAAAAFPEAAGANRNVFYHRDGSSKTVSEVYNWAVKQQPDTMALAASGAKASVPAKPAVAAHAGSDESLTYDYLAATSPGRSLLGMTSLPHTSFSLTSSVLDVLAHFATPSQSDEIS